MRPFRYKPSHSLPTLRFVGATLKGLVDVDDTKALACYKITIPAGKAVPPAFHKKAIELIWCLRGTGVVEMRRSMVRMHPGDALIIQPHTPHGFRAGVKAWTFLAVASPRVDSRTDFYPVTAGTHGNPRVVAGRWKAGA